MSDNKNTLSPELFFDFAKNISNELFSVGLSQLKLINVSQQQLEALLMNGMQKDYQAYKEQVALIENMLEQLKDNQQNMISLVENTYNETMNKFKNFSMGSNSQEGQK